VTALDALGFWISYCVAFVIAVYVTRALLDRFDR